MPAIGIGISPVFRRGGGVSWATWWTTLISAVVENAAPTHVVLTFPTAKPALGASDFTIAGFTISSASWTGAVLTLVLSTSVVYGDSLTVTFVTTGGTHVVTNNTRLAFPSANADLVQITSIDAIASVGSNISGTTGNGYNWITNYKSERIRQTCNLTDLSIWVLIPITHPKLQIYRKDGATYDRVGEVDLGALLTDGSDINTVTLPSPIAVQEGDFVCWSLVHSSTNTAFTIGITGRPANSMRYTVTVPSATDYAWDGGTGVAISLPTHCKSSAPLVVCIGDSLMESYPLHRSMIDLADALCDIAKSWEYKLKALDARFTYQNVGMPSQSTTMIESRFNRDVVLIKPKFAIINGGINDIATAGLEATFLAKWTSMLDMCHAAGIIPVVWKMMPCTGADNTEMANRDTWNVDLVTLFNSYSHPEWVIIDFDADLGVYRVGGAAGNLWDINPTYDNGDGTHLNEVGQAKLAEVVLREIGKVYAL